MTKFKDVAHLYVGCKMRIESDHAAFNEDTLDHDLLSRVYGEDSDLDQSTYKPILRPLSSMTDEECEWISKDILFDNYLGFECRVDKEKDRFIVYDKGNFEGDQIHILFNGEICSRVSGRYSDICFEYAYSIVPYLLSKGFDLFDLISSGKAIDSTTV